ncbi:hypothetical protein Ciccas_005862 [Cichlidogyrus casuarinus]|uniref:Uncharacterized protein n=1 Tax=Cichlidogyrus casuarinus TaxID=1844966 RepID=A0ABD2Q7I1_9PLAT
MIRCGEWAVITGCTSGIGRAITFELAKDGLNIVLISQNQEQLMKLSEELESTYKIKTSIITVNFCKSDVYQEISKSLSKYKIACLINNVGISYDHPDSFAESQETSLQRNEALINCNNLSMAQMTRIVLEKMYKDGNDCPSGSRVILNFGSFSGSIVNPFLTTYSATKSFVETFTKSLALEVRDKGIIVQGVRPYFVATNMSKIKHTSLLVPSAQTYAKSCLNMLGVETFCAGYFFHELVFCVTNLIPEFILGPFVAKQMLSVRAKSLKRRN